MNKINWAILAPGGIAAKFAAALNGVEGAHAYSVASRSKERAEAFAKEHGFETVAEDYQALMADPKVDVIYVASPHSFHVEQAIACLNAGKAVLCEKPMAINAADAERVFAAAKENNTFFMEAVWSRFMPMFKQVHAWINAGHIGDVKMVQATFGIAVDFDAEHRLYNAELAGGSLLDVGIYPITFAQIIFQDTPQQIAALGELGGSDVDEQLGIVMSYPNGAIATLNSSITTKTNHEGWIFGTKGSIKLANFWHSEQATLIVSDTETVVELPHRINGYEGEIEEVNRCLNAGLLESPTMSWQESLNVMNIMDEVRAQIGLKYPMES